MTVAHALLVSKIDIVGSDDQAHKGTRDTICKCVCYFYVNRVVIFGKTRKCYHQRIILYGKVNTDVVSSQ